MNNSDSEQAASKLNGLPANKVSRVRFGLFTTLLGLFIFMVGARPSLFGWDRSVVVGFIQIAVFLIGLAVISTGGYISLMVFWNGHPRSIAADIGMRLVSTGYVIAVFSGMADVFGMGTQTLPTVPSFGHLQEIGVEIGEAVIALGFFLLFRFHKRKKEPEKEETPSIQIMES